jgi:hypothetical protein
MRRHEFNAMACCRGDSGMAPRCRGTQASDQASHGKHQPRQHQHDHQLLFQPARHAMPKRIDPDRREAKPGQARPSRTCERKRQGGSTRNQHDCSNIAIDPQKRRLRRHAMSKACERRWLRRRLLGARAVTHRPPPAPLKSNHGAALRR